MIIVDTDVLIEIFDKHSLKGDNAIEKIEQSGEQVAITSVSLLEILYGIYKYGKNKIPEVERLETIDFSKEDASLAAKLELDAEKKGHHLSRTDAMIAAIALNKKAKLFTFNTKHFQDIPKLVLV
ncbi:MAG: type II toxin-antitoxin system VapC family toxin [Methanobacteriota archaeon]